MPLINNQRVRHLATFVSGAPAVHPTQQNRRRWTFTPQPDIFGAPSLAYDARPGRSYRLLWRFAGQTYDGFTLNALYPNLLLEMIVGEQRNYLDMEHGFTEDARLRRFDLQNGEITDEYPDYVDFTGATPMTMNWYVPLDDLHRTADRWLMDWDADDSFDHADSDVTADVQSYDYEQGLPIQPDLANLPIVAARGLLRLRNQTGKYSADSPAAVSTAALRRRVGVRHVNSAGGVMWEGFAEAPNSSSDELGVSYANFPLSGKAKENLRRETYRVYTSSNNAQIFRDVAADVGLTVGEVTTDSIVTGEAVASGRAGDIFKQIRAFSGGWIYEDETGRLALKSSYGLDRATTAIISTADFDIQRETRIERDVTGVKNSGQATEITTKPEPTSIIAVVRPTIDAGASYERTVNVVAGTNPVASGGGIVRYSNLTYAVSPALADMPGVTVTLDQQEALTFRIRVDNTGNVSRSMVVTLSATLHTITQLVERNIERTTSQTAYGTRVADTLPDWYSEASLGYAEREISRLSQPLLYAQVLLPRWQRNAAATRQLQTLKVGNLVGITAEEDGAYITRTMFVASVRRWRGHPLSMPRIDLGLVELWNEAVAGASWTLGVSVLGTDTWLPVTT